MHLMIVDDHAAVRDGLEHLLSSEFPDATFDSVSNGEDALRILAAKPVNIILLDLRLAGTSGLELLPLFKNCQPSVRILIHTMYTEEEYGLRALRSGADGYLTKDQPVAELFHAVRLLRSGKRYASPFLAEMLANFASSSPETPLTELLSDREYEVLRMLSDGKSTSAIATELRVSVKTVSTYRLRMLEKLGLESTAGLIRFGIEHRLV